MQIQFINKTFEKNRLHQQLLQDAMNYQHERTMSEQKGLRGWLNDTEHELAFKKMDLRAQVLHLFRQDTMEEQAQHDRGSEQKNDSANSTV